MSGAADVSLVMPVWRSRPDWLLEAVRSALDQRGCQLELIVVDDGNSEPVASTLAEIKDPRLKIVRVDHSGPYATRNAGLAEARAPFVRFVDADDVVEPESTARLLSLAQEGSDVIAYGDTLVCDEALRPLRTMSSTLEGDVTEACLCGRFTVRFVSMLFPRGLIDRAGGWSTDFVVSGDWDFTLRVLELGRVRRDPAVETHYRRHRESVTKLTTVAAGQVARRMVVDRYFERHPERRGTALERRAYGAMYVDGAAAFIYGGHARQAAAYLARAARFDPVGAVSGTVALGRLLAGRAVRRAQR